MSASVRRWHSTLAVRLRGVTKTVKHGRFLNLYDFCVLGPGQGTSEAASDGPLPCPAEFGCVDGSDQKAKASQPGYESLEGRG